MSEIAINIQGRAQGTFAVADAQTANKLEPGVYDVWADGDAYLKVDQNDASDVTTSTGYKLVSGNVVPVQIASPSYLGAAGAATNIYYHKTG